MKTCNEVQVLLQSYFIDENGLNTIWILTILFTWFPGGYGAHSEVFSQGLPSAWDNLDVQSLYQLWPVWQATEENFGGK